MTEKEIRYLLWLEHEDIQKIAELTSIALCEICISDFTIFHDET